MSAFPQFISSVTCHKILGPDDLIRDGYENFRTGKAGFSSGQLLLKLSSMKNLFPRILERLPETTKEGQRDIETCFSRIMILNQSLFYYIELFDSCAPKSAQCRTLLAQLYSPLQEIQKHIPYLAIATAPTMERYLDTIKKAIETSQACFEQILVNVLKFDIALSKKSKPLPVIQRQYAVLVSNALQNLGLFETNALFAASFYKISQDEEKSKNITKICTMISSYIKTIYENNRFESVFMTDKLNFIISQFPFISRVIGEIKDLMPIKDFTSLTVSAINTRRSINELISKLELQTITNVIKSVANVYLENEPTQGLIQMMKSLLNIISEKYQEGLQNGIDKTEISSYKVVLTLLSSDLKSKDEICLVLLLAVRFTILNFPDFSLKENLLLTVSDKTVLIVKIIYKEFISLLNELRVIIDQNVENLNENDLNQLNYFLKITKKPPKFDTESDDFLLRQQSIFDAFTCVLSPLMKLINKTQNETSKNNLSDFYKKVTNLQRNFSMFLNSYYMCFADLVRIRSEDCLFTLFYPLQNLTPKNNVFFNSCQNFTKYLQFILSKTPKILTFDISEIFKLINLLNGLPDIYNDYLIGLEHEIQNPLYKILQISAKSLQNLCLKFPKQIISFYSLLNINDKTDFSMAVLAGTFSSLNLINTIQNTMKFDITVLYQISFPVTFAMTTDHLLTMKEENVNQNILQNSNTLKSSYDVIWQILLDSIVSEKSVKILSYVSAVKNLNNELYNLVLGMDYPKVKYELPQNISQLKKYSDQISLIKVEQLKIISQVFMKYFRSNTNVLDIYFSLINKKIPKILDFLSLFDQFNLQTFVQKLCEYSISIYLENDIPIHFRSVFNENFENLIKYSSDFIRKPDQGSSMLQIVDKITRFDAIYEIKDLKQNDFENYYKNVMRNLLISLNNLKISIKTPKNNVLFGILSYLNKIEIFQEFCGQKQVETQKSKEIVISGFYKSSTIDDLINQFLRYLTNVDSVLYHGISMMVDQDNMVNIAYDKSEIFRNEIKKGKEGKISEIFLSVSDIFVIVSHVLSISDYIETPLSLKCSITFLSLIQKLAKYNSDMKKGSKNKDFINNLINDLDYLINIIEYPKFKEPSTPTSFRLSQYGFYNLVLRLSAIFSFIIELSTWSVIPLMYEEGQRDFLSLMNAYIPITQTCSSYFSNLDPKIKKIYEKFENSAQNLVNESKNIRIGPDFESFLPALNSFASDLISLSNSISEMKQEMSIKIDKNVINQIPDDYILPVTPEIGRLPISVFNEIKILSKPFDEILTKISSELSSIDENKVKEIIKSLIEFRKIAENFCEISLSMISSIPDFSNQIRVQTVLYNISSLISSLQNIVRSKLLGALQNDKEISENLTKIKCQKEKLINLTQEISSQNVVKNNDDASNSLTVCAQEVGETLSKLFVLDEKQKSNFDSKILLSAARIVERARQLTMMQIEKHGHIDNEKGMIHAAGEVTEAVKLFLIVAEMKNDEDLNYKIVSAAKIINASVASLVACVNVKGGDKEKIINDEIKNLKNFTEKIIKETEAKIFKKLEENDKKDNKKVMTPVILKLNLQNEINAQWKKCEEEEKKLYEFRKRKI